MEQLLILLPFTFVILDGLFPLPALSQRILTFEDVIQGGFGVENFNGSWVSDKEICYRSKANGNVLLLDVSTQETSVLIPHSLLAQYNSSHFLLSADKKWVAIPYHKYPGFRYSNTAKYAVHELKTGFHYEVAGGGRVQLLEWSPVGHALVYVMDNDIYYQHKPGPLAADRITQSGLPGVVFNGIADWVYEEEVFSDTKTLWFSPEGTKLAFATFDDSAVHEVNVVQYGTPGSLNDQYVHEVSIRYPKAGSTNPKVSLNVVDLRLKRRQKIVNLPAPVAEVGEDNILGMVKWVDDSHVSATWSPRVQNAAVTVVCGILDGDCSKIYEWKEPKGWVDWPEPFFKNLSTLFTILPHPQAGDSNFKHLTLVTPNDVTPITSGRNEVIKIIGWNQNNSELYYTATLEENPGRKHLYSISDDGSESPVCISCDICGTAAARFSQGLSYMVLTCQGPDIPTYSVYTANGAFVMNLGDNSPLKLSMKNVELPQVNDMEIPIEGNMTARVRLLLPPEAENDEAKDKKYPLLLSVYGGPDSQRITDNFSPPGWEDYLVTHLGIVAAFVDARGSGRRGDSIKFAVHRNLGGPEIQDFTSVAKYLQDNLHFIDKSRTAIWGWSYGGFATAMTLAKDTSSVFKCGISVAPVTSWIYYDSIYTERYMGLPTQEDNLSGYNASDITRRVGNFRNKQFLLIHGNADDNVHYQQSMALARALETKDILFSQQSYPDEAHGLSRTRLHLYHTMEKFLSKCFEVPTETL